MGGGMVVGKINCECFCFDCDGMEVGNDFSEKFSEKIFFSVFQPTFSPKKIFSKLGKKIFYPPHSKNFGPPNLGEAPRVFLCPSIIFCNSVKV